MLNAVLQGAVFIDERDPRLLHEAERECNPQPEAHLKGKCLEAGSLETSRPSNHSRPTLNNHHTLNNASFFFWHMQSENG